MSKLNSEIIQNSLMVGQNASLKSFLSGRVLQTLSGRFSTAIETLPLKTEEFGQINAKKKVEGVLWFQMKKLNNMA